jgi:hypothetical protein
MTMYPRITAEQYAADRARHAERLHDRAAGGGAMNVRIFLGDVDGSKELPSRAPSAILKRAA